MWGYATIYWGIHVKQTPGEYCDTIVARKFRDKLQGLGFPAVHSPGYILTLTGCGCRTRTLSTLCTDAPMRHSPARMVHNGCVKY